MYIDNAHCVTLKGNTIESTGDTNLYCSGYPFNGIQAANETYIGNYLDSNTVQNNKTNKCSQGFAYYSNYGNYNVGMKNTTVSGNTFQNSLWQNVLVQYSPGHANNKRTKQLNQSLQSGRAASSTFLMRPLCRFGSIVSLPARSVR